MKYLTIILSLLALASCRTTKYIKQIEYVQDSTAIRENEALQKLYKETVEAFETRLEESTGITIEYRDTGSVKTIPGKVIYKDGGFQAEGELKSVKVSNTRLASDNARLRSTIDSLTSSKDSSAVGVRIEYQTVEKKVVRNAIPWYWWLILAAVVAGFLFKERLLALFPTLRKKTAQN